MYRSLYQLFRDAHPGEQHYASHSHHYWPDVTRDAMLQYWEDSARLVDDKWEFFFGEKVPAVQRHLADIFNVSEPAQFVFAPNTHELLYRLITCHEHKPVVRVLTTDSEFHSFERQIRRLAESPRFQVERVATQPFQDFEDRFIDRIRSQTFDLIFFSHVFFDSGVPVRNLDAIVQSVSHPETTIAIDGYHAFMAIPTNLSSIAARVFYLSGSYKYAQAGEGCCFMWVPPECSLRPVYTGWFAGFDELRHRSDRVGYSNDGYRFAGSTMDFAALYRLLAVLELFQQEGITVQSIHAHIQKLQRHFREQLALLDHPILHEANILHRDFNDHGHFFAFETGNAETAKHLHDTLRKAKIRTDYRGNRLRFGFGLYQDDRIRFPAEL